MAHGARRRFKRSIDQRQPVRAEKEKIMRASRLAAFALACTVISSPVSAQAPSSEDVQAIVQEAYIYLYPLVTMDISRRQGSNVPSGKLPGFGPMNTFSSFKEFPDANFKAVVRPNFDTLYSSAWIDLTAGPVIISAPDTKGRYYLLPMLDMWTDVFAVPGKRTSGTEAANFALVPPGWSGSLPAEVNRIDATTPYVWIIGRTQTDGPKDYDAVHAVQVGYKATPLKDWGKPARPIEAVIDPKVDMETPALRQVNTMPPDKYFAYAAELMKINPPHKSDWSTIARLKRIGLEPGKSFNSSKVDAKTLEGGAKAGLQLMQDKVPSIARVTNGWQMNTDTMGVYGNFYLKRAIVALIGLGANQTDDAIYPFIVADADGDKIVGGKKYILHFNKDELPPVGAFWSLTMYDAEGFQVPNPINRFAIGDRDALKFNRDGSLDLYLQNESPGPDREANWLPTPATGELGPTLRLYAPKPQVADGRWNPPPIRKAN